MAHMVETLAYAGLVPWHGLGVSVPSDLTPREIQIAAGLDWTVRKIPAFADFEGTPIYSGHDMLIRESDGQPLDMVKKDWNPVQNDEAFDFFEEFVEAGDMTMETAGSLQDGKRVFALAKINEDFEIGGDVIEGYLLFTNPHIYGRAVDIRFTPVRVVCNNTLTLSLGQKSDYQVSMTHKKAFDPNEAKKLLGLASEKLASYKEMAEFLTAKRYTDNSLREYFATVFPAHNTKQSPKGVAESIEIFDKAASRNAKRAFDIVDLQPGAKLHPGTMWNAFNAVTYLTDHELGRSQDSRLASAWYGLNKVKKVKALETALDFAKAA
jgi:phage/plasmid-like protein (TIGR03299 family)